MKKNYFLIIAILLVGFAANAQLSGTGSEVDPYLIEDAADLVYLSQTNSLWSGDSYFSVTSDIDMTGNTIAPIGQGTNPFSGTINGNNKVISNLVVAVDASYGANDGIGLIGASGTATIANLGLSNANIQANGKNRAAFFVGNPQIVLTLTKCFVDGGIFNSGGWGGSFVGVTWSTVNISDCWSSATLTLGWGSAALVGDNKAASSTFTNLAFYGTVSGQKAIGLSEGGTSVAPAGVYFDANSGVVYDGATSLTTLDLLTNYTEFSSDIWEISADRGYAVLQGFAGLPTDVSVIDVTNTKVYCAGKTLYISTEEVNEVGYIVYNLSGSVVAQGEFSGSSYNKTLSIPKGLYIVKVGDFVTKIKVD